MSYRHLNSRGTDVLDCSWIATPKQKKVIRQSLLHDQVSFLYCQNYRINQDGLPKPHETSPPDSDSKPMFFLIYAKRK